MLRFFAGKGGVGKTTCAAAFAVAAAADGRRTLLISTDPAPSLGDALRLKLTSSPRLVPGTSGRLAALEIDASRALERWLRPRRQTLETIALQGTWLDREDVAGLLGLSLPGIDEVAALMEIGRLGAAERHDLIVVDTAPTGHTLRMLAMPELLRTLAVVFDRMYAKHRAMVEALRGRWEPEEGDALVESIDREARALAALLSDRRRTAVSWVTLPEPMSVAETSDALRELHRLDVTVDTLVINRLTPAPPGACRWCQARRSFEGAAVAAMVKTVATGMRVATIEARVSEPRGRQALATLARELHAKARLPPGRARRGSVAADVPAEPAGPDPLAAIEGRSLVLFGGKGGVGKTTCAAAFAVAAASRNPRRSVLLLSVDPAHSLADVLGVTLGDDARAVSGAPANLRVREIDARARFDEVKRQYAEAIDALFGRLVRGSALNASADRRAMQDLIELAPPGLDELIAVVEVSEALDAGGSADAGLVVLDTAPSGHALRLLEMPALVHDWVKALMAILLKYQPLVGLGELGPILLRMSQGLGRLRSLLADPERTAFVAVTRPAVLPVSETIRLVHRLERLDIHVPAIVANAAGAGTCRRCAAEWRAQGEAIGAIRRKLQVRSRRGIVLAPAIVPPPHGAAALGEWRRVWAPPLRRSARKR
jgi:arsenite-transporting ATPase